MVEVAGDVDREEDGDVEEEEGEEEDGEDE